MKRGKSFHSAVARLILLIWVAELFPFGSYLNSESSGIQQAGAADSGANGSFIPPTFGAGPESIKTIFTSCMGLQQSTTASVVSGALTKGADLAKDLLADGTYDGSLSSGSVGPVTATTECPLLGKPKEISECGPITDSNGTVSLAKVNALKAEIQQDVDALSCRELKLKAIKDEMSCLQMASSRLAQIMHTMQQAFQTNIQRMNQDVANLTSMEADRTAQYADAQEKLMGGPNGVPPGIEKMRATVQAKLEASYGEISQLQEQRVGLDNQKKQFEEAKQARTTSLAMSCFRDAKQTGLRCIDPNNPKSANESVTFAQYTVCRYKENQRKVGKSDVIDTRTESKEMAEGKASDLENLMGALLGDAGAGGPKAAAPAGQGGGGLSAGPTGAPTLIQSAADVESQYSDQLASFNGKGLDIRAFVLKKMNSCFNRASRRVKIEENSMSPLAAEPGDSSRQVGLGSMKEGLKSQERQLKTNMGRSLDQMAQVYTEGMRAVTGVNLPVNISLCKNAKPNALEGCLSNMQGNLEGLLKGTTQNSGVGMIIKGNNPATNIGFSCSGLNGCSAALTNVSKNLQVSVAQIKTAKQNYIMKSNQTIEQFVTQMAAQLGPQNQALSQQMNTLNSALASLGISAQIDPAKVDSEELTPGPDGIYGAPKSAVNLIGSKMNPVMANLDPSGFSKSLAGITEGSKALGDSKAEIATAKNSLLTQVASCAGKKVDDAKKALVDAADALAECPEGWQKDCDKSNSLKSLGSVLDKIRGDKSTDVSAVASVLDGAFEGACAKTPSYAGLSDDDKEIARKKTVEDNMDAQKKAPKCKSLATSIKAKYDAVKSAKKGYDKAAGAAQ